MKRFSTFALLVFALFIFFSCKENPIDVPDTSGPDPADTTLQRNFKLVFLNLGTYSNPTESLTAFVTFEEAQRPDKLIQLTAPVLFDSPHSTPILKLPKGAYKIRQLIINDASGATRFATPVTGSPRAAQISKPLSVSLVLEEKVDQEVQLEVLPVGEADTPQSYGYPTGTFGKGQGNPQPPMDKRVLIRSLIQVGEVVYDSLPAQLIVKSWDAKGEMDYKIHYMAAGTQGIYLSAKAVRFQLSISKWGTSSELVLQQAEVKENDFYTLVGKVAAKKLKSVMVSRIAAGVTRPETKTDYEYNANGEIKQRLIWGKRDDLATYLMQKDIFTYTNGQITTIQSYDEDDKLFKTLVARYNNEGRVTSLEETNGSGKVNVTALYLPVEGGFNTLRDFRIDAKYEYENGQGTEHYSKIMSGGSAILDTYLTSNGSLEEGTYDFDFCINPYVHLKVPDLRFTQYTKHNLVVSRKFWRGNRPQHEPYDFKYTYDADGYPKELLTKYRTVETKADAYVLHTVFVY